MADGSVQLDKISLDQLEKEVTCGICQEYYTDPKILPCLHYYCKQCVLRLVPRTNTGKPFHCPECRCKCTLPEEGVEGFKSAFFVNRFKSTVSTLRRAHGKVEVKCEACSGDKANSFCHQCAMFICQICASSHSRMKSVFVNHQVVGLQDLKKGVSEATATLMEPSPQKCPDHNEDMKIFCFDCSKVICRDCTVIDHKDHIYQFCKVTATAKIEELKKELEPLKQVGGKFSQSLKEMKTIIAGAETEGVSVAQIINTSFDKMIQIVEQRREELLEEARRITQDKIDKLSVQEKALSLADAEIKSVIDYAERYVNHCSDSEVMSMHKDIKDQIMQKRKLFSRQSQSVKFVLEADLDVQVCRAQDVKEILERCRVVRIPIDTSKWTVEGEGLVTAAVGRLAQLTLTTIPNSRTLRGPFRISSELKSLHDDLVVQCVVDQSGPGKYLIQYTPTVRGRHELTVDVNGHHISGSPFAVFVSIHPSQLGRPVQIWNDLEEPSDITINSKKELIVSVQSKSVIVRIGSKDRLMQHLELDGHHVVGLEMDKEGFLYLTLFGSVSLYKLTLDGKIVIRTQSKFCSGHFGVAVVGQEVMVCPQPTLGTVLVYTKELRFVKRIRKKYMGQLRDISSDSSGNLYVSDRDNHCICVLSNQGYFLNRFGNCGNGVETLTRPLGLCVSEQYVYVCNNGQNTSNHNIYVFTTEGKFVTKFGSKGGNDGQFNVPVSICMDQDKFIYITDYDNQRIQKI